MPRRSRSVTRRRQLAFHRTLDLTAAFAQLRRNERQAERRVDVFFAFCGKELAPAPQSVVIKGEALAGRQRAQLLDVLRRAGRKQQSHAVMALVGQMNRKPAARRERCRSPVQRGSLGHKRKVARSVRSRAAGRLRSVMRLNSGCALRRLRSAFSSKERRPVHVAASCAAAQDLEVLQNLRLQRAAQPFHALEAVLARGLLQILRAR